MIWRRVMYLAKAVSIWCCSSSTCLSLIDKVICFNSCFRFSSAWVRSRSPAANCSDTGMGRVRRVGLLPFLVNKANLRFKKCTDFSLRSRKNEKRQPVLHVMRIQRRHRHVCSRVRMCVNRTTTVLISLYARVIDGGQQGDVVLWRANVNYGTETGQCFRLQWRTVIFGAKNTRLLPENDFWHELEMAFAAKIAKPMKFCSACVSI